MGKKGDIQRPCESSPESFMSPCPSCAPMTADRPLEDSGLDVVGTQHMTARLAVAVN